MIDQRILVSSLALRKFIDSVTEEVFEEDMALLVIDGGKLSFRKLGWSLDVPVCKKNGYFEMWVKRETIARLKKFLTVIDEQPLGLGFDPDNSFVNIIEAIL